MAEIHHNMTDDIPAVSAVMLWRIYDVLMGIFSNINPDEATSLVRMHQEGMFVTPPPAYVVEGEDGE